MTYKEAFEIKLSIYKDAMRHLSGVGGDIETEFEARLLEVKSQATERIREL